MTLHDRIRAVVEERRLAATNLQRRAQEHDLARQELKLLGRCIPGWYEWPEVERLAADAILSSEHALGILERHAPSAVYGVYCNLCMAANGDNDDYPCSETLALATRWRVEVDE